MLVSDIQLKLREEGFSLPAFYNLPGNQKIRWYSYEEFGALLQNWVPQIIKERNYQPMIDETWKMKCPEDYDDYHPSYVQRDFERQLNHQRTKIKPVSLEELQQGNQYMDEDIVFDIPDLRAEFEEKLVKKMEVITSQQSLLCR